MKKLEDFALHITLYAKNHYKKTGTISDLRKIIATITALDPQYVTMGDIYKTVVEVFMGVVDLVQQKRFLEELFKSKTFFCPENEQLTITISEVIVEMISYLQAAKIGGYFELGDPDYNILPPYKSD